MQYFIFCSTKDVGNIGLKNIDADKWQKRSDNVFVYYAGNRKRSDTLIKQIEKIKPDAIFAIGLYSWHFTFVPLFYGSAPVKILSVRGMLHPGALSQKRAKKKAFIFLLRRMGIFNKAVMHATDNEEAGFIRSILGEKAKIMVAPNFPRLFSRGDKSGKQAGSLKLLTIALISPMKNLLPVLEALGRVEGKVDYTIAGAVKDMDYWQQCLSVIRRLPANIKVNYLGELEPNGVADLLNKHEVFILPSLSENYGHAIVEALSAGLPVITSHNTPWSNLEDAKAGINLEPGMESIAGALQFFINNTASDFETWSLGACAYTSNQTNLEHTRKSYDRLFGFSA